jgi:hypothetical protein
MNYSKRPQILRELYHSNVAFRKRGRKHQRFNDRHGPARPVCWELWNGGYG